MTTPLDSTNPVGSVTTRLGAEVDQDLDWSNEKISEDVKTLAMGQDYDPRPKEDQARRHIAYLLIGLLVVVVGSILILVACGTITVAEIKDFSVVLGPVVTLVSAATGFYYGTKSK
jgi:hypothetical protein